ncbi:hypothetical protein ACP70R_035883 [Stipagrostis hirtigluma subsp. patula]
MAASSSTISCCLGPPAPPKEATATRLQPTPAPWSGGLRRACVAAAACAVMAVAADGGGGGGGMALARDTASASSAVVPAAAGVQAPPRWSDRRRCPPWRANSLENIVPENLPRPSARRPFNSVTAAETAPALAPDTVAPFLARRSGMGCFSL